MTAKEKLLLEIKKRKDRLATKEDCDKFKDNYFKLIANDLKIDSQHIRMAARKFDAINVRKYIDEAFKEMETKGEKWINKFERILDECKIKELIIYILKPEFILLVNKLIQNKEDSTKKGLEYKRLLASFVKEYVPERCIQIYINIIKKYFAEQKDVNYAGDLIFSFFIIQEISNIRVICFLEEQKFIKTAIEYMEDCINKNAIIDIKMLNPTNPLTFFGSSNVISTKDYFYEFIVRYNEEIRMKNSENEIELVSPKKQEVQIFIDDENPITPFYDDLIKKLIDNIIKYGNMYLKSDIKSLLLNSDIDNSLLIKEVIYQLKKHNINHNTNKALIFLNKKLREMEEKNKGNGYKLKRNIDDKNSGC